MKFIQVVEKSYMKLKIYTRIIMSVFKISQLIIHLQLMNTQTPKKN